MLERQIRLYGIPLSHPVLAAKGMLDHKGLSYRYVELLAGAHPPALWALGFRGATVPAIRLADGRRAQGSLVIAQALEQTVPSPSLYPDSSAARAAVANAEHWGEAVLQPIPRRLIRWGLRRHLRQRQWFAEVASPLPAPALAGLLLTPIVPVFSRLAGANDVQVRRDLDQLPAMLDEVDRLLEQGVIGGDQLHAADFQIAASVRMLLAMRDLEQLVSGRRAETLALRVVPEYPEVPAALHRIGCLPRRGPGRRGSCGVATGRVPPVRRAACFSTAKCELGSSQTSGPPQNAASNSS
ncbi:MAG: glutathione S-transferase N-terminal domain-containing protein [Solirubrobacteraceae bacterium]